MIKRRKQVQKKIESIRKNLENKVKGILYADVEDGVLS